MKALRIFYKDGVVVRSIAGVFSQGFKCDRSAEAGKDDTAFCVFGGGCFDFALELGQDAGT